eukprot:m.262947 g.262947  ORF g.262947 m.262947 type:complete len:78 (+) comp47776_c0_seq1:1651-1884(+)
MGVDALVAHFSGFDNGVEDVTSAIILLLGPLVTQKLRRSDKNHKNTNVGKTKNYSIKDSRVGLSRQIIPWLSNQRHS